MHETPVPHPRNILIACGHVLICKILGDLGDQGSHGLFDQAYLYCGAHEIPRSWLVRPLSGMMFLVGG